MCGSHRDSRTEQQLVPVHTHVPLGCVLANRALGVAFAHSMHRVAAWSTDSCVCLPNVQSKSFLCNPYQTCSKGEPQSYGFLGFKLGSLTRRPIIQRDFIIRWFVPPTRHLLWSGRLASFRVHVPRHLPVDLVCLCEHVSEPVCVISSARVGMLVQTLHLPLACAHCPSC